MRDFTSEEGKRWFIEGVLLGSSFTASVIALLYIALKFYYRG